LLRDDLCPITVAGRREHLCERHRQAVARDGRPAPDAFEDLAQLFSLAGIDRRRKRDRRRHERRQFPPRPEGRRHNMGRRGMDPPG
jgi:hypothetical protein